MGINASPIVELNRAVALGMCHGPTEGLMALERIAGHSRLVGQHLVPAVRGDLLARAGLIDDAAAAFQEAADLAPTDHDRRALSRRAGELQEKR